jgi:hypothetical protein
MKEVLYEEESGTTDDHVTFIIRSPHPSRRPDERFG